MKLIETTADYPIISDDVYNLCSNHIDALLKVDPKVAVQQMTIWRGVKMSDDDVSNVDVLGAVIKDGNKGKNRRPVNTNPLVQDTVDRIFKEVTGYRLRGESVFVSNEAGQARVYGNATMSVLLPNEFSFFWVENIRDLTLRVERFLIYDLPHIDASLKLESSVAQNIWVSFDKADTDKQQEILGLVYTEFRKILPTQIKRATNLQQVVTHFLTDGIPTEGMLVCDRYAVIDHMALYHWLVSTKNDKTVDSSN